MMAAPATARLVYENTVLASKSKRGVLKPDTDGYYPVNMGALNIENSAGEFYAATPISRGLFSPDSSLIRRINSGVLYGELSHPNPADSRSTSEFMMRVRQIKEDRIAVHIRRVWLEDRTHNGRITTVIMGEIKPMGAFAQLVKDALENPDSNISMSGRYISNLSTRGGQIIREPHTCITWDVVLEGGIALANKYDAPSLESRDCVIVNLEQFRQMAVDEKKALAEGVSLECAYRAEELYSDLLKVVPSVPQAWKKW